MTNDLARGCGKAPSPPQSSNQGGSHLLSTYYVQGAELSASPSLSCSICMTPLEWAQPFSPILQMRKWRFGGELTSPLKGHASLVRLRSV